MVTLGPSKVFISYSRSDEHWLKRLRAHLKPLEREYAIEIWDDCKNEGGDPWREGIRKAIDSAQVAVLLVSADFLASDFIASDELPPLLEAADQGRTVILPVILSPSRLPATLSKFQAVNDPLRPLSSLKKLKQDAVFVKLAERIESLLRQGPLIPDPDKKPAQNKNPQGPEFQYPNLFRIGDLTLPYATIIGGWQKNINEYARGDVRSLTDPLASYVLPEDFRVDTPKKGRRFDPACRLLKYDCEIVRGSLPNLLTFTFSRISYPDYLRSGEHLDDALPKEPGRTFRDKYASRLYLSDFASSQLTNICGVGIFLVTRDDRIIVSQRSSNVEVYPNVWSYSASGTMDWSGQVHPFAEVARECFEEINHKVIEDISLFAFGLDTKRLYFQFSFVEYTGLSSDEILAQAPHARDFNPEFKDIQAIPFTLEDVIPLILGRTWEPAACAGLLTLCAKEFGLERLERILSPNFVRTRTRKEMSAEWDRRALRRGELAVMSARYPSHRCQEESEAYIQAVEDFIGHDIDGKDVLEVGAGIGRLTEWLVRRAGKLTCLDLSERMLESNRQRLGAEAKRVIYRREFAQDYKPDRSHDVVLSSLVLIHNIDDEEFYQLGEVISSCAPTVFLFEHTDVAYQVSSHTRPRSEEDLVKAFHQFRVEKRQEYQLFSDRLVFLKLVRWGGIRQ
jgi:hypothetical protein